MGLEGGESGLVNVPVETVTEGNNSLLHEKENGKIDQGSGRVEPIKFGTHITEEPIKEEVMNSAPESRYPKDAVDEWPAPKRFYSFYIMKYRSYDDQNIKTKLDRADRELQKLNQSRSQIIEKLREKRADRAQLIAQLRNLGADSKQFRVIMDEKRKQMEPLQQALGKLRSTNSSSRERSFICSSEDELNDVIKSLQYRIQHESIPLSEEKQILREIKQLEGTRDKVIANAAIRAQIQDSMGEKEVIQDQVKLMGGDLDGVRKEQQLVKSKLNKLDEEKEAVVKDIESLEKELTALTEKRDKAYDNIKDLRKQRDDGNTCFYQNRMLLNKARELSSKKDVESLKELTCTEVDKFFSLWSSSKAFRDDYEKRILSSLDMRQLSRDARMSNPGEKPLVSVEAPTPSESEIVAKQNVKQPKDDTVSPPQNNTSAIQKVQKEKKSKNQKEADHKETTVESSAEQIESKDAEGAHSLEKLEKATPKRNEVDEAKLKEMKREEEIAKAKQALERKKKLAEKAAAKAAIKAQKDAEKKLKEREKKAKKKAGVFLPIPDPEEPAETVAEAAEPEKADAVDDPIPSKNKEQKGSTVKYRSRAKASDPVPKMILKRKKSTNYWLWAAPTALIVLFLLVFGYYYLL